MELSDDARQRLVDRAREELPEPGDPRRLMADLGEGEMASPEAMEILSRTSLAWQQLRDLRLERAWQSGFGWFLARTVMLLGLLVLFTATIFRPTEDGLTVIVAGFGGVAAYYLLIVATSPLRLRRHHKRKEAILNAYREDLENVLKTMSKEG